MASVRDAGHVRAVALTVFVVITGVAVAGPVVTLRAGEPLWPSAVATLGLYPVTVVGALIAVKRPRNPIGWLCLVVGAAFALEGALWGIALYGFAVPGSVPAPAVWAVIGDAVVMPGLFLMASLLILLFPDGRLPSPRWRWLARITVVLLVAALLTGPFLPTADGWGRPTIENPIAVPVAEWIELSTFGLFGCVVASVVAVVLRFRRSTGIERLQLRWLAAAATAAVVLWAVAISVADVLGDETALAITIGGFLLVPIAIGVAVLRYRLFEIDRLISRTVTYALLAGVLASVYVGGVLLLALVLPAQSELAVAASTLTVAALFTPLRRRVQVRVDRRFSRSRYDAARTIDAFGARLRDRLDLDDVTADLLDVVAATMQPSSTSLWMRTEP